MKDVTVCFTYFKSLSLMNLAAALYSVRRQDLSRVEEVSIVDNDTVDSEYDIERIVDDLDFPVPVFLMSSKHGDASRTHSWSTNVAVRLATTPWVLFSRADYLLNFDTLQKSLAVVDEHDEGWNGFVTGNGCHLAADVAVCEETNWRQVGPQIFSGAVFDYTKIDSGVWMARKEAIDRVGGMNETLDAWGHAQTEFQFRLHKAGTEFVRIPEVLFYHLFHGAPRDIGVAHAQLQERGIDLKEMWSRYEGVSPY